jgi:diguanylate cyclase (GGDEF)-like protein
MPISDVVISRVNRLVKFITFVDLPIRGKFLLFSLGVMFWFLVLFTMSLATLIDINTKSSRIVESVIPHDRIAQKTMRKLQSLQIDANEILKEGDLTIIADRATKSGARIDDIKSFLSTFRQGGKANDYTRDTNEFVESFEVAPVTGDPAAEAFVDALAPKIAAVEEQFKELVSLKLTLLSMNRTEGEELTVQSNELSGLLREALGLCNTYSADLAKLYGSDSKKIKDAVLCTSTAVIGVLVIALGLLVVFTIWISRSLSQPINSMIKQVHLLAEGTADLSKKITVASKDEVGTLSGEINGLIEAIHGMNTFKKVIEEDDNLDDVYSRLGREFREEVGLHQFVLFEIEKNEKNMKPVYPIIFTNRDLFCNEDILVESDLCRAKKTGHRVSSLDYPGMCKQFLWDSEKEHICLPMIVGGSTGGVVQFLFDKSVNGAIPDETIDQRVSTAEKYLKESLSVIEAKKLMNTLRESAIKDAMTGLHNRRFLQEYAPTLVASARRRKKTVGLIIADLDYFKEVNDTYGHDVGDSLLRETAQVIRKSVRDTDLVIRFGGEEFLVLLIDVNPGESVEIANKIRLNMESNSMKVPDGTLTKTISLGVSEFPADSERVWQAIKFADVALYEAKKTGRNKVVRFAAEMWTEAKF